MADESTILDYSDVLADISSDVSDLASFFIADGSSTTFSDMYLMVQQQLIDIIYILDNLSLSSDVASTVALDSTQFEQLMTIQTSELIVQLFILAFVIMTFGVLLAHLFMKNWKV